MTRLFNHGWTLINKDWFAAKERKRRKDFRFQPSAFSGLASLFIGVFRQPQNVKLYQNIVILYGMWKPRLEKTVLDEQVKSIESKRQKLPPDKHGTPLGTNI